MTDFIEINENGVKSLINLAWVEEIRPSEDKAVIYFAFQGTDCVEQDNMTVDETYEELKERIWGVTRNETD